MNVEHWMGYALPDTLGGRESIWSVLVLSETHDRPVRYKLSRAESVLLQVTLNSFDCVFRERVCLLFHKFLAICFQPRILFIGLLLVTLNDDDGVSIIEKTLLYFHLELISLQDVPVEHEQLILLCNK